MRHGKYRFIVGALAAPLTLYLVFVVGPYLQAFYIALTNWRGVSASADFVGLSNFSEVFHSDLFWKALRNHGVMLLAVPLITISIALLFAFLLNVGGGGRGGTMRGVRGSGFYRIVFFFPQVLSAA